jgi:hypothetical protein
MPEHIFVSAPEGVTTPIGTADGIDPNGSQLKVTAGEVARVRYSGDVRRAIRRGDLFACTMTGTPVDPDRLELADAPEALDTGAKVSAADLGTLEPAGDEIEAANRRHRQAPPDRRPPLPDGNGPQSPDRRNRPAPSPHAPLPGPPETTVLPPDISAQGSTMDAMRESPDAPFAGTAAAGTSNPKGR